MDQDNHITADTSIETDNELTITLSYLPPVSPYVFCPSTHSQRWVRVTQELPMRLCVRSTNIRVTLPAAHCCDLVMGYHMREGLQVVFPNEKVPFGREQVHGLILLS